MKIKEYFMPKSLIYTGTHKDVSTKIIHYQYNAETVEITNDFIPIEARKHYIQVIGLSEIEKILGLKKYYKVNPLILEDVFNVKQRNKLELYDDFLFGAMHVEYLDEGKIKEDYMSILLNEDAIISFHETEPVYLAALPPLFEKSEELRNRNADYLFYQIFDIITDNHLDIFDSLATKTASFEEEILESKKIDQENFYLVRKEILKLKNCVSPVLEELDTILDRKHRLFWQESQPYFEDLTDHLQRLDSQLNQSREEMRHLLDLLINNQSNKMNQIMTTLTLFSAVFIPLSFLAGFFGMNFVHFQVLQYEHAIELFVGGCVLLAVVMLVLFKKMKWF